MSWIIETGNNLKTKGQVRDRKKNKIIYIYNIPRKPPICLITEVKK
jgi:hypothetical protein